MSRSAGPSPHRAVPKVRGRLIGVSLALLAIGGTAALPAAASPPSHGPAAPPPSVSTPSRDPATRAHQSGVDPRMASAMAKQYKVSVAEATRRLGQQKRLGSRGASIEKSLAGRSGGSYLDSRGRLVVTTLDARGDAAARAAGVRARRVDDSSVRLQTIMTRLDRLAARGGSGGLQGWYVDIPHNSVVVTVSKGAKDQRTQTLVRAARRFGSSVTVQRVSSSLAPRPASSYLVGGDQFVIASGGTCSIGFNTRDAAGRNVVLTAGHCVSASGIMSRNGYQIGATRTANYPTDDFGTFWNSYPTYWLPSVSVDKYNGTYVNVRGRWDNPPVGATVCKSGRTTGYTCGSITALNQTVVYTGGYTVYGLVRHNACVEPGDSGGSNISSGAFALGMTSGASTSAGKCLSKSGSANVSWYQPIGEALSRNGLTLLYQP